MRHAAADALGLPFVRPYWSGRSSEDFAGGANFAVGAATALSPEVLWEHGFTAARADLVHLDMEMKWFRDLLHLLCPTDVAGMLIYFNIFCQLNFSRQVRGDDTFR